MNSLKRFVLCAFAALGLLLPPAAPSHAAPESTMDAIVKRGHTPRGLFLLCALGHAGQERQVYRL